MNLILTCLVRCFVVLAGYAIAAFAASAFLTVTFVAAMGVNVQGGPDIFAGSLFFAVPFVALFAAYFAFIPSLPVLALAEILGRRDWLFYALGGGVIAFAVLGYFWRATAGSEIVTATLASSGASSVTSSGVESSAVSNPALALLFIAAGMFGGIAYWLVAGRTAGNWRSPPGGSSTSPAP